MAAVQNELVFPTVYVNHCSCPFIFTSSDICFKSIRQSQRPSFFHYVFFVSIVKYNVVGTRNFQQMFAVQPLRAVDQFPVQICIIQKSTERHVRVVGTLMFIKTQCFVNQKWQVIFIFHINNIFQSRILQIIRIRICGTVYRIIQTQRIFSVFTKQFLKYDVLIFTWMSSFVFVIKCRDSFL